MFSTSRLARLFDRLAATLHRKALHRTVPVMQILNQQQDLLEHDRDMRGVGGALKLKQEVLHAQMRKELGMPKPRIHVKAPTRRRAA